MHCPRLDHFVRFNPNGSVGRCGHMVNSPAFDNLSLMDNSQWLLSMKQKFADGTFPNVHWTVSVESIEEEFEYIRYGGKWVDFVDNLTIIKNLEHKISFNMLHFLLNYQSLFTCIEFLQGMGFHPNSFVVGQLLNPDYLNIRHLPANMLMQVGVVIQQWLDKKHGFLLDNGLENVLKYISIPINSNIDNCLLEIAKLDSRRGIDSKRVFTTFYKDVKGNNNGNTV